MKSRGTTHTADVKPRAASTVNDLINGIGYVSVPNRRTYHEDRVDAHIFKEREKYSSIQWQQVFRETIQELQDDVSTHKHEGGSTLCCVVADGSKALRVCSIGDSSAYLVVVNKSGRKLPLILQNGVISEDVGSQAKLHVLRLTDIHKPEKSVNEKTLFTEDEQTKYPESYKIFLAGGTVSRNKSGGDLRTSGRVNMSRAIGDLYTVNAFKNKELSHFHIPATYDFHLDWPKDWKERGLEGFVVVVSDGVNDARGFAEERLATIVETWSAKTSLTEVALKIVEYAVSLGTSDNITACVMKLSPGSKQLRSVMVADGHGGEAVVNNIRQHFHAKLAYQLTKIAIKEIHPSADAFLTALSTLLRYDVEYFKITAIRAEMESLYANCISSQSRHASRKRWTSLFASLKADADDKLKTLFLTNVIVRYEPFYRALKNHAWGSKEHSDAIADMQKLITNSDHFFKDLLIAVQEIQLESLASQLASAQQELEEERKAHRASLNACKSALKVMSTQPKSADIERKTALVKIEAQLKLFPPRQPAIQDERATSQKGKLSNLGSYKHQ